jgi:hypothetical protein
MHWMRKRVGLGATIAHFVLREENGVYVTACGRVNAKAENWMELNRDELILVTYYPDAHCGSCHYSPRSIRPENFL